MLEFGGRFPALPHPLVKLSIVGGLRDREVAGSASDPQGLNFESCVCRAVLSHSSHHHYEVLPAQFCAQKWHKARFISFHLYKGIDAKYTKHISCLSSKHYTINQWCLSVGPPSTTLFQHSNNIVELFVFAGIALHIMKQLYYPGVITFPLYLSQCAYFVQLRDVSPKGTILYAYGIVGNARRAHLSTSNHIKPGPLGEGFMR